ncbi:DUF4360 domain-containing protein [Actinomadura roseirufa]|uniref:DUF4360 domain-containing protein n=1 Tax=Actinomadura roseirufa TaxID=2094049 RepID=UPI00104127E2|nr:DUF4360 domain-containing protein [Actinomadura roseirufa]
MRKRIAIPTAAAGALAMITAAVAPANAAGPHLVTAPPTLTLTIVSVNGSGCPLGTAAVAPSPLKDAFTITYSNYTAQAGGNSKPPDARKNCQINLRVNAPGGFTYAISSTDYRGYAALQPGAEAIQNSSYYIAGLPTTKEVPHRLNGAYKKNWQFTDTVSAPLMVWKPCGEERNFNINTELRVDAGEQNPTKVSLITVDSIDSEIRTTYRFAWKTCP